MWLVQGIPEQMNGLHLWRTFTPPQCWTRVCPALFCSEKRKTLLYFCWSAIWRHQALYSSVPEVFASQDATFELDMMSLWSVHKALVTCTSYWFFLLVMHGQWNANVFMMSCCKREGGALICCALSWGKRLLSDLTWTGDVSCLVVWVVCAKALMMVFISTRLTFFSCLASAPKFAILSFFSFLQYLSVRISTAVWFLGNWYLNLWLQKVNKEIFCLS